MNDRDVHLLVTGLALFLVAVLLGVWSGCSVCVHKEIGEGPALVRIDEDEGDEETTGASSGRVDGTTE